MTNDYFKQSTDFTDKIFKSAWLQQVTEYYKALAEKQQAYSETTLSNLSSHMSDLANIKNPQEFISCQHAFIHNNLHRGIQQLRETLSLTADQLDELLVCCQSQQKSARKTKNKS